MFGAVDGGTRAILEGNEIKDVALATVEGGIGGALVGNIFGHGGSAIGKGAQKLGESFKGSKNIGSTTTYIPTILQEFKQGNKIPKNNFMESDLKIFLKKLGYTENENNLIPPNDFQQITIVNNNLKSTERAVQNMLGKPISHNDLNYITQIINSCNPENASYLLKEPQKLILLARMLQRQPNMETTCSLSTSQLANIISTIKNSPDDEILEALVQYKFAYEVNSYLRILSKKGDISGYNKSDINIPSMIEKITSYIDNTKTVAPMEVFRGDGINIFEEVLINGKPINLYDKIIKIIGRYDIKKLEELLSQGITGDELFKRCQNNHENWIQNLNNLIEELSSKEMSIEMPAFMSVTLDKGVTNRFREKTPQLFPTNFNGVQWTIDVPVGSKCVCIDAIDPAGHSEMEFLFQRGSKLQIKDIELAKEDDKYYIKITADVFQ